jgi:hypothetical protein
MSSWHPEISRTELISCIAHTCNTVYCSLKFGDVGVTYSKPFRMLLYMANNKVIGCFIQKMKHVLYAYVFIRAPTKTSLGGPDPQESGSGHRR